jgi:D-cysteine desulfhydrase
MMMPDRVELRQHLWIKDDGAAAPHYGGNKPRKLEYLLHDAPRRVATMGARGSHHALATAVHGSLCGHEVHVVTFPRPTNEHVEAVFAATELRAIVHVADDVYAAREMLEGLRKDDVRIIPAGGSSPVGALGFVRAGNELIEQIEAGVCPEPRRIYIAMGTAGTIVGLSLALHNAGLKTEVRGIRVVPDDWLSRSDVEQLARDTATLAGHA